jgi:hypothetical protein
MPAAAVDVEDGSRPFHAANTNNHYTGDASAGPRVLSSLIIGFILGALATSMPYLKTNASINSMRSTFSHDLSNGSAEQFKDETDWDASPAVITDLDGPKRFFHEKKSQGGDHKDTAEPNPPSDNNKKHAEIDNKALTIFSGLEAKWKRGEKESRLQGHYAKDEEVPQQLDFFVAGFPKCGTTSLLYALRKHPETSISSKEVCFDNPNVSKDEAISRINAAIAELDLDPSVKRGVKCPTGIRSSEGLDRLQHHSPNTRMLIGVRHPVQYFESFYNYRVTEHYDLGAEEWIPPIEYLLGDSTGWKGVHAGNARFELSLMQLGKTDINPQDQPSQFKIFMYSIEQLDDPNEERAAGFRQDMQDFLGLQKPLDSFSRENVNHFKGEKAHDETIDICDERYKELRFHMAARGKQTQLWIRDEFLKSPDVFVGDEARFLELIQTWGGDPCEDKNTEESKIGDYVAELPKTKRPTAIIHVGPRKTGSTAIQSSMKAYASVFDEDNYALPAVSSLTQFSICLAAKRTFSQRAKRTLSQRTCKEGFLERLTQEFEQAREESNNILVSNELLDDNTLVDMSKLRELLSGWEVTVVVTYRRFCDFGEEYRLDWGKWRPPDEQRTNIKAYLTRKRLDEFHSRFFSAQAYQMYTEEGFNTRLISYHTSDDIVETMFCLEELNAIHACKAVRQNKMEVSHSNIGESTAFDEIAVAAYEAGLIDGLVVTRPIARNAIQEYHEQVRGLRVDDLPKDCVSEEELRLLEDISLADEKLLSQSFFDSAEGKEALRSKFKEYNATKLCAVDTEAILQNPSWREFLSDLGNQKMRISRKI